MLPREYCMSKPQTFIVTFSKNKAALTVQIIMELSTASFVLFLSQLAKPG